MCAAAAAAARLAASASLATSRACRAPSAAEQAVLERVHAGPRGQARLPASSDQRHRACAHALPIRDDGRRLSDRGGLFGSRALCRHHVCRHARIEPAGREAPAVRHRVHHQPVPQRGEQRGVERRRRAQPGAGRRAVGVVRHGRPARRRLPASDRRQRCNRSQSREPQSRAGSCAGRADPLRHRHPRRRDDRRRHRIRAPCAIHRDRRSGQCRGSSRGADQDAGLRSLDVGGGL